MTSLNTTLVTPMYEEDDDYAMNNVSELYYNNGYDYRRYCDAKMYTWIIQTLSFLCCVFGLVGNGKVIWLLGFSIKKNPFTTYILNLAIADSCTLLIMSAHFIMLSVGADSALIISLVYILFFFTYNASIYLLIAISMKRCLSILFPFWYRCHRPGHSSATVSFLLWVLSGLLSGMMFVFFMLGSYESSDRILNMICTVNFLIFTPLMIGCAFILSVKICRSSQEHHPAQMHTAILITLTFFIVFGIPISILVFIHFYNLHDAVCDRGIGFLLAIFNSSIHPVVYYLIGRDRKQQPRESLQAALQRLFTDSSGGNEVTEVK